MVQLGHKFQMDAAVVLRDRFDGDHALALFERFAMQLAVVVQQGRRRWVHVRGGDFASPPRR